MSIGIAVITFNREKQIEKVLSAIDKTVADFFVVVNDTEGGYSVDYPDHYHIIQHDKNKGVGPSKNDALKYLMEKDCEHLFLIEDDMLVKDSSVFQKYIDLYKRSGVKHFNFSYHGPANMNNGKPNPKFGIEYDENIKMAINKHCVGAVEYFHKDVIDDIGYIDETFKNAWDHPEHTFRAIKQGYHPPFWNFADLYDSYNYFEEIGNVKDNSVIRKGDDHTKNIAEGREYFKQKHGVDILHIPETTQQSIYAYLERKEKEIKEELEKKKVKPKVNLEEFSIIFPIKVDTLERIHNLNNVISFYRKYCDNLQFIIVENDTQNRLNRKQLNLTDNDKTVFLKSEDGIFNKCRSYNIGAIHSNRKNIIATDVDCVVNPERLLQSKAHLNSNTFVKPYSGLSFYMREYSSKKFKEQEYSFDYLKKIIPHPTNFRVNFHDTNLEIGNLKSPGGCVVFERGMFLANGGYNTNFKNWGYEDNEIINRFKKLGNVLAVIDTENAYLWHLHHKSTVKNTHPHYQENRLEAKKIDDMTVEQLREYIKTFK